MAEKEYIEREALLDRIRGTGYAEPIKSNLLVMAVTIPAADVRPVVRGKWIQKEKCYPEIEKQMDYRFECSECGFSDIHNATLDVPFCWHCGAKMEDS